jgi:peptide/nickel transport system ATP-binding protein
MLDAVTQQQIWSFLVDHVARENIGLMLISHSPALTARLATRCIDL